MACNYNLPYMLGNGLFSTVDRGKTKSQKDFLVALTIEEHYNLHIMRRDQGRALQFNVYLGF
jgi:hypothetical protein